MTSKRKILFFVIFIWAFTFSKAVLGEIDCSVDATTANPKGLTKAQYSEIENIIIICQSGSGGYALEDKEISWIKRARNSLKARNIPLDDDKRIHDIFGWSYFNFVYRFEDALAEFKLAENGDAIEITEWMLANSKRLRNGENETDLVIKSGPVALKEIKRNFSKITGDATTMCTVENERFIFESTLKGGIYRYDRANKTRALIYVPASSYDWVEGLYLDGNILKEVSGREKRVEFNNDTNNLTFSTEPIDLGLNACSKSEQAGEKPAD